MKKTIILFSIFLTVLTVHAQHAAFEKVSKQKTVELGYRHITDNSFDNKASGGYTLLFDYAWKLSGYNKKKAVYLSIPLGYTYLNAKDDAVDEDMRVVSYGWTVRHELAKDKKVIPFVGYGLLLNQLSINDTKGSIMGHQTRFELGANFRTTKKLIPFIKIEYTYSSFASLGKEKRSVMQFVELKTGFRF